MKELKWIKWVEPKNCYTCIHYMYCDCEKDKPHDDPESECDEWEQ